MNEIIVVFRRDRTGGCFASSPNCLLTTGASSAPPAHD